MSVPGKSIGATVGLVVIAIMTGLGGTFWYRQGGQLVLPRLSDSPRTTSEADDDAANRSDPEWAAILELIEEVKQANEGNPSSGRDRLRILFEAADRQPAEYSAHAAFVANKLVEELPGSEVAEYAQSYLILAQFRQRGADDKVLLTVAQFAKDFPASALPFGSTRASPTSWSTKDTVRMRSACCNTGSNTVAPPVT